MSWMELRVGQELGVREDGEESSDHRQHCKMRLSRRWRWWKFGASRGRGTESDDAGDRTTQPDLRSPITAIPAHKTVVADNRNSI